MTNPPPATPPPWRPRGHPAGPDEATAPHTFDDDDFERTVVMPVPQAPPPALPAPPLPPYPPPGGYGPPRAPGRSRLTPVLLAGGGLLLAVVLVVVLLSTLNDSRDADRAGLGGAVTAPATTTTTRPPGEVREAPAPLGTAVTPAQGWSLVVTEADLDADDTMAAHSFLARPRSGHQFVLVSLAATNEGAAPARPAEIKLSLVTSNGDSHGPNLLAPTPRRVDAFGIVQPGATVTGNVAFDVPTTAVGDVVLVAEPLLSLTPARDRRFLAVQ